MDNFALVRPEHLNHHGFLFGGALLKWIDEFAWLAATRDYPGSKFVTVGMEAIVFRDPVHNGSILRFHLWRQRQGTTSVTYSVEVFATPPTESQERPVFSTRITFVQVDDGGRKMPLGHQV